MEIYKELNHRLQQKNSKVYLICSTYLKVKIEEGKIIDGVVTKITDKFVFYICRRI